MSSKLWMAGGTLFLATFSMAYGKSFEVLFSNPVQAGNLSLRADTYRIGRRGDEAIFNNLNTGRVYKTSATVMRTGEKNATTTVKIDNVNGQQRIESVALGGHAVDLSFNR